MISLDLSPDSEKEHKSVFDEIPPQELNPPGESSKTERLAPGTEHSGETFDYCAECPTSNN